MSAILATLPLNSYVCVNCTNWSFNKRNWNWKCELETENETADLTSIFVDLSKAFSIAQDSDDFDQFMFGSSELHFFHIADKSEIMQTVFR